METPEVLNVRIFRQPFQYIAFSVIFGVALASALCHEWFTPIGGNSEAIDLDTAAKSQPLSGWKASGRDRAVKPS